jgi:hypothetical protein
MCENVRALHTWCDPGYSKKSNENAHLRKISFSLTIFERRVYVDYRRKKSAARTFGALV